MFCNTVCADTINLHWINYDGTVYENSTCVIDSDLILPATAPTRYGYTFTGWEISSFIPLEYIESTGTQWIDTGIVPVYSATKIEAELEPTHNNQTSGHLFGCGSGPNGNRFFLQVENSKFSVGMGNTYQITTKNSERTTITFQPSNIIKSVDVNIGNTLLQYDISSAKTPTDKIRIGWNSKVKIYSVKIYYEDTLVRDFAPALDDNSIPCMYEKVEKKYYYNQGTGQFVAGYIQQ